MARPASILCCRSSSWDKDTFLFSAFEFIETLNLWPVAPKEGEKFLVIQAMPFRIVAHWMIELDKGDKYGEEFEFEFRVHLPAKSEPISLSTGKFKYESPHHFHRLTLVIEGQPPFEGTGVVRAESRIRKIGTENWIEQDFPFHIITQTEPVENSASNGKPKSATP